MLSKESKIRVLENFYALDYVLFGKPINKIDMCCPLVKEEYLSIKGALMSVYVEMMKLIKHQPEALDEKVDSKLLMGKARNSAIIAREHSEKIVKSDKARANIKSTLKEALSDNPKADISHIVEKTIRSKAFGLAVDSLLLSRAITESEDYKKLNEWEGRIVEDSYKILRDNLIEAAYMILYDDDESLNEFGWGGQTPQEQMKDAKEEEKQDWIEERRRCMKYRTLGQPEKEKQCLAQAKIKHDAHWKKVYLDIKSKMKK
jgi:hypothetical protein